MKDNTAILLGATGLTGSHCLQYLLHDGFWQKIVLLLRRPIDIEHPGLKKMLVDFDHLEKYKDAFEGDTLFCCLGTTIRKAGSKENFLRVDYHYVVESAKLASAMGCKKFIVISAVGANPRSLFFYNRVKGTMEEEVKKLKFESIHILRPSLLTGNRKEHRTGESLAMAVAPFIDPLLTGKLKKYRSIPAAHVARVMVELAKRDLPGIHIWESDEIEDFYQKIPSIEKSDT